MEELVLKLVNQTKENIFLTGRAGTGKTTLLRKIVEHTHKSYVIVAPTAVAAINAGGVTIHSFFQLPFHPFLPSDEYPPLSGGTKFETRRTIRRNFRLNSEKKQILRNLELLVIDEVSMVRPDLLDVVDEILRDTRQTARPFGGVQVLFIGDLLQLPPIIRNNEWNVMQQYYASKYFFDAAVLAENKPVYVELTKIYRQSDALFIELLQKLRDNTMDQTVIQALESRITSKFSTKTHPGYIVLTTHNTQADAINSKALTEIDQPLYTYEAEVIDDFPERAYPLPSTLKLKVGAQVMFIKNDLSSDKLFYNGKIGEISRLDEDEVYVYFPEKKREIRVEKYTWENIVFGRRKEDKEIAERVIGTFTQYPMRLAWAITVHKSQGLTFTKAAIDISQAFAPGQAYVALSRLTSLDGLILLAPLSDREINIETALLNFTGRQEPIEKISSKMGDFERRYLLESTLQAIQLSAVEAWVHTTQKELKNLKPNSIWNSEKDWLESLISTILEIKKVARSFALQISHWLQTDSIDNQHLHERVDSATEYFYNQWVSIEKRILQKIADLSIVSRVGKYQQHIRDLEEATFSMLKKNLKLKKRNQAIAEVKPLAKNSIHVQELVLQKAAWIEKIKKEQKGSLAELTEFDESPKEKSKPKKKIPTAEITLALWQDLRDVDQVAEQRKLKPQTIMNHLVSAVEKGQLALTDLCSLEVMEELHAHLQGKTFDSLSAMKQVVPSRFTYPELKLYRHWSQSAD